MTRLLYNASKFILVVMSLTHISLFLYNATKLFIYLRNIQIDFGEGILLGNAKRLTKFLTIYPDIKVETIFWVYPPLYQLLSAGMISITGLNLHQEVISTIASIITAILIYKSASTQDKFLKITFPALYYPLALLFSLSILKIRATTNYYVEPVASTILFIAASSREISKKRDLLMIAFTLLMISQFIIYSQNIALVPQYRRKSSIFKQTRATRLPTKRRWLSIM
ncbi:MAG: hypothetical protein DRN03_05725 [Thermoplasmata archaeon]|nr:MAG: hypothetical protein DRN03_05725 [Thermoplasmata archaeon]